VARKDERRIEMALMIARFPCVRELDGFDFAARPSIDPRRVRELLLARDVAEEAALAEAGGPADVVHGGRRVPPGAEDVEGGIEPFRAGRLPRAHRTDPLVGMFHANQWVRCQAAFARARIAA
jgi:hypothetical protein